MHSNLQHPFCTQNAKYQLHLKSPRADQTILCEDNKAANEELKSNLCYSQIPGLPREPNLHTFGEVIRWSDAADRSCILCFMKLHGRSGGGRCRIYCRRGKTKNQYRNLSRAYFVVTYYGHIKPRYLPIKFIVYLKKRSVTLRPVLHVRYRYIYSSCK